MVMMMQLDDSSEYVKISHLNVAAPVSDGVNRNLERRLAAASEGTSTSVLINDLNLVCVCLSTPHYQLGHPSLRFELSGLASRSHVSRR